MQKVFADKKDFIRQYREMCREKYGNTNGKYQEEEGAPMVKSFLSDCDMNKD
jgi:hypothetical protein